eukprot:TRINITY_DN5114_c0_g1_i1.p1 TRINITY_DN5114_c0_g1~~TRINITY_DN5114_c0_g1_i1.p1  ORF type:complete len:347 (+),score=126.27 TRINITY_DN5114_c0_g1_i1:49-1041(+)
MSDPESLSPLHQEQLERYLKFAKFKRDQFLRDVQVAFKETRESRLNENHYTKEEVEEILESLSDVLKGDVARELQHVAHTTTVLLKMMFAQAETIMFDLYADTAQLENERLIKEIALFEDSIAAREKDPKKNLAHISKPSDAALQHNINKLNELNKNYKEGFEKMQKQQIEMVKARKQLEDEVARLNGELTKRGIKLDKPSAVPPPAAPTPDPATLQQLSQAQKDLASSRTEIDSLTKRLGELTAAAKETPTPKDLEELKKQVAAAQAELTSARKDLSASQQEFEKKINQSTPFLNMKKMLQKKNSQVRTLRELLVKYDPKLAESFDTDE